MSEDYKNAPATTLRRWSGDLNIYPALKMAADNLLDVNQRCGREDCPRMICCDGIIINGFCSKSKTP